MDSAKTHDEMRAELIEKAAGDQDFRARLIDQPKAAIKEALGLDLPDSVAVQVHEESALTAHLVLPPSSGLTDEDLEGVAAGHTWRSGFYQDGAVIEHTH